jgi:hypothetical protein
MPVIPVSIRQLSAITERLASCDMRFRGKRTADPPLSCPGSYATIAATGRLARDSHLCAEIDEKVPFSLSGFYFRQLP